MALTASSAGVRRRVHRAAIGVDLDGMRDVFLVICDGLTGPPHSVNAVFPQASVRACILHLIPAHDGHVPVRLEGLRRRDPQGAVLDERDRVAQRPLRRAVTTKGHVPTEQAALNTLSLVTRSLDPKGTGQARWGMRWKPALNAFAVTFADRRPTAEHL